MNTTTYSVPGLSCEHCRSAITSELDQVAGVEMVIVDLSVKSVSVLGDFDDAAAREAIDNAGYDIAA
jgi:copper chaperone CopZ